MASFTMLCYALDSKRTIPFAPMLPRVPDNALPIAGDTVTLRGGNVATVMGVAIDHDNFDEPTFYLSIGVKVTKYAITGICEQRIAA